MSILLGRRGNERWRVSCLSGSVGQCAHDVSAGIVNSLSMSTECYQLVNRVSKEGRLWFIASAMLLALVFVSGCVCPYVCLFVCLCVRMFMCMFACAVDIREIKEVREGTDSKDFERQQVELKKIDQFCFVIYYTSEFKPKTLSVAGTYVCACACMQGAILSEHGGHMCEGHYHLKAILKLMEAD